MTDKLLRNKFSLIIIIIMARFQPVWLCVACPEVT